MEFLQKIAFAIRHHRLLVTGEKTLVAVSGGADSVALLLALKKLGHRPTAAHCNFHLRGEESNRDEHFVGELCWREGIELLTADFDTEAEARAKGESLETAARRLRYEWFGRILDERGLRHVAVAHHAEDNVETFFLNLVRGAGLQGLCGMQWCHGSVVRPMLEISRQEIEDWLATMKQPYVTDSTNADVRFRRNNIRHRLLPLLREMNPSFDQTMTATLRLLNTQRELQANVVADAVRRLVTILPDGLSLETEQLAREPAAQAILFHVLRPYGFGATVVNDMMQHLAEISGHLYETERHLATRTAKLIEIRRRPLTIPPTPLAEGDNELPDGTLLHMSRPDPPKLEKKRHISCIDADRIRGTLHVRSVEKGDRFKPYGLYGSKLLSDYLADRKRSRIDRLGTKVVCDDEGIVWLVGECTAQRAAISESTRRMIRIELL